MDNDKYSKAFELASSQRKDLRGALVLLREAFEEGDLRAGYALATWEHFGNTVVDQDQRTAFRILTQLRDSFIAEAYCSLAVSFDLGTGTRKNERLAAFYYMEAALLGNKEACQQVAEFFREGKYFPKSIRLYEAWKKRGECEERDIAPPYREWLQPQM
jgi:TPR repeat protein